ncbi:universal stress protein [Acidobacteriota bacterium]
MTATSIHSVGFCAHYSSQGDWAFNAALNLARQYSLQLNVFHFLSDPYNPDDRLDLKLRHTALDRLIIEKEKELRFYYDEKLGDYLNAGFRLCEDKEWTELHRCLCKREFQVLFLGYPYPNATFGGKPIENFADSFVCPVVLVGPEMPNEYHLNRPAVLLVDRLGLSDLPWSRIEIDNRLESRLTARVTTGSHGV